MPELISALANAFADRYTLERELGRGAMATVFLTRDLEHDRPVGLKVLQGGARRESGSRAIFHRDPHRRTAPVKETRPVPAGELFDPLFHSWRTDPRYSDVLREMGLAEPPPTRWRNTTDRYSLP